MLLNLVLFKHPVHFKRLRQNRFSKFEPIFFVSTETPASKFGRDFRDDLLRRRETELMRQTQPVPSS